MNVARFLTPKSEVVWVPERGSFRAALERMDHHRFTAVPILDESGRYVGTLTEGDLLRKLKETPGVGLEALDHLALTDVPRRFDYRPVDATTDIETLLATAVNQNFVPVVDGRRVLMGIVRRRAIIEFFAQRVERDG